MNPNQFEFTLTNRDMAEAYKNARRRLFKRYLSWKTIVWLAAFMAFVMGIGYWSAWITPPTPVVPAPATPPSLWSNTALPLLPWIVMFAVIWFFVFWKLRAQHKNHRLTDRPHVLIVEDGKMIWNEPFSRLEYQWQAFYGHKETKNLFLLYLSDPKRAGILMFHLVPKRAFTSPDQLTEFRQLLAANVHARASGFPVIQPLAALPVAADQKAE